MYEAAEFFFRRAEVQLWRRDHDLHTDHLVTNPMNWDAGLEVGALKGEITIPLTCLDLLKDIL